LSLDYFFGHCCNIFESIIPQLSRNWTENSFTRRFDFTLLIFGNDHHCIVAKSNICTIFSCYFFFCSHDHCPCNRSFFEARCRTSFFDSYHDFVTNTSRSSIRTFENSNYFSLFCSCIVRYNDY